MPTLVRSAFENQGQICLCGSRILVEEKLYPEFVERFVAATRKLKVGDPLDPTTDQGAVISTAHFQKIMGYIRVAREEGGKIVCGGEPVPPVNERCKNGVFVQPTIVTNLPPNCRVNQEEIFGPVATVMPFRSEAEAVETANGTPYGLSASLWTKDVGRVHRVAERLQSGTVWVNSWLLRDLRSTFWRREAKRRRARRWRGSDSILHRNQDGVCEISTGGRPMSDTVSGRAPKPVGAYPHAKRVGNLLFLSGIGPREPGTDAIPGNEYDSAGKVVRYDIAAQCRSVFRNVRTVLDDAGSSWGRIVDVTVFLTNMRDDFATFNRLYAENFTENRPTRTTVEVRALPTPIAIELKVIATIE